MGTRMNRLIGIFLLALLFLAGFTKLAHGQQKQAIGPFQITGVLEFRGYLSSFPIVGIGNNALNLTSQDPSISRKLMNLEGEKVRITVEVIGGN